jgi:hypothetical protein
MQAWETADLNDGTFNPADVEIPNRVRLSMLLKAENDMMVQL